MSAIPFQHGVSMNQGFDQQAYTSPSGRLVDPTATSGQRTYATFTHLSLLVGYFTGILVIPALIMWLIKKSESGFLDDHGREALNFQISLVIYTIVSGILCMVLIGIPLLIAVFVLGLVGMIKASIAANRGEFYRYPATIRLIA